MEQYKKVDKELSDLVNDNIRKLEAIFPSVIKDGQVDFEELKELLGYFEEVDKEKYELNWVGKKEAKRIALEPIVGKTLKYVQGDGVNEDITENLYIEGDNLEVLKLLQNSYYGKVKMIYIDPPYNTGNDRIYVDNFKENKIDIEILEGDRNEYGERLIKNQKTSSYYHSKWLNMMYSRLLLCKNTLKEEGVIFISIDDNEIENLKKICNEVFGESNFIDLLKWKKKKQPSFLATHTAKIMEYILVYAKNKHKLEKLSIEGTTDSTKKVINISNNRTKRHFKKGVRVKGEPNQIISAGIYTIRTMSIEYKQDIIVEDNYTINDVEVEANFSVSQEKIDEFIENDLLFITAQKGLRRDLSTEEIGKRKSITDLLLSEWGDNQESDKEFLDIFDEKYFDYVKPIDLIKNLIKCNFTENEVILDFFSGSATTAHSVLKLNSEDYKNRKYIMIQVPENIEKNSIAYNSGYRNICEIGKERIRKAGERIIEENKNDTNIKNLDIGFKVFKVDNSNIKWENKINEKNQFKYNLDGIDADDMDFMPNTKDIDVVYEILLRQYGIPLTAKIDKLDFIGGRTYTIENSIIVCLENKITKDIINKISELEPIKVIFRDSAFGEDISLKQNSIHRLNVLIEKNNRNTTHVVEFI